MKFNTRKRIEVDENKHKDGNTSYQLMKNAVYGETKENLRNRIDEKLANNENDSLKCTSKPRYILH